MQKEERNVRTGGWCRILGSGCFKAKGVAAHFIGRLLSIFPELWEISCWANKFKFEKCLPAQLFCYILLQTYMDCRLVGFWQLDDKESQT